MSHGQRPLVLLDAGAIANPRILPDSWLSDCEIVAYPPGALLYAPAAALSRAHAVVLRSMTRFGPGEAAALPSLQALATLSSGVDHVTVEPVPLRHGRGGNAVAVADWVVWALSRLWRDLDSFAGRRVAVVGVGAVGSAVSEALARLKVELVLVDPPRARHDATFAGVSLDEAIEAGVDAITLHVPRIRDGVDVTMGLLDLRRLNALSQRGGAVVLNAARGGVLDEVAAVALRRSGRLAGLALDVFVAEPSPDPAIVDGADLVTPHIAGHSIEGKLRVGALAIAALRRDLGLSDASVDFASAVTAVAGSARAASAPLQAFEVLDATDKALRVACAGDGDFTALRGRHLRSERGS